MAIPGLSLSCWHHSSRSANISAMTEAVSICPGSCNARWRELREAYERALAAYDPLDSEQSRPEPLAFQPIYGEPAWCGKCAARIGQCLAEMDDLAGLLNATADGHRASSDGGERVSGSAEALSPSQAADDLEEMAGMLTGWETAYRDYHGWNSPPRRGFLADSTTTCIDWLGRHLDGILSSPIAHDFGTEVVQWHREFRRKSKAGVRRLEKPLRCPSCQMLMLTWTEGEDRVDCNNPDCMRVFSYSDYEAEVEQRSGSKRPGDDTQQRLAS